jgi:hypothetical protein
LTKGGESGGDGRLQRLRGHHGCCGERMKREDALLLLLLLPLLSQLREILG